EEGHNSASALSSPQLSPLTCGHVAELPPRFSSTGDDTDRDTGYTRRAFSGARSTWTLIGKDQGDNRYTARRWIAAGTCRGKPVWTWNEATVGLHSHDDVAPS